MAEHIVRTCDLCRAPRAVKDVVRVVPGSPEMASVYVMVQFHRPATWEGAPPGMPGLQMDVCERCTQLMLEAAAQPVAAVTTVT